MPEGKQVSEQGEPSGGGHGTTDIDELAQQFSEVARSLQAHSSPDEVLAEVVASAIQLIPGVDEASISVVIGRRNAASQHPSGELPQLVDAVQTETGEGPCLEALYEQQTVKVPDMASEQRWPQFARRAADLGAGSMLSFQLYVKGDNLGALNLYGRHSNAFDDESEQIGLLFASHAAVAFADAKKIDHLQRAVDTRDLIGQAKGILMERYKITAPQAFQALTRVSQRRNTKIRLIAEELTATRNLTGLQ